MTTQTEMLQAFAPEFVGDTRIALALSLAAQQMATSAVWGNVYDQAVAYLAAHLLTSWGPLAGSGSGGGAGGVAGPVTSESAGDVSRSYGSVGSGVSGGLSVSDAMLAATRYGQQYIALRRGRAEGAPGLVQAGSTARLGRSW